MFGLPHGPILKKAVGARSKHGVKYHLEQRAYTFDRLTAAIVPRPLVIRKKTICKLFNRKRNVRRRLPVKISEKGTYLPGLLLFRRSRCQTIGEPRPKSPYDTCGSLSTRPSRTVTKTNGIVSRPKGRQETRQHEPYIIIVRTLVDLRPTRLRINTYVFRAVLLRKKKTNVCM